MLRSVILSSLSSAVVLAGCGGSSAPSRLASASVVTEPTNPSTPQPSAAAASPALIDHPFAGEEAWIAYQTMEGVWLIHPDGTGDHEVARDVPGEHLHPDWAPDGSRLVITSREARDTLYEVDLDSDDARVLWECTGSCVGDDEAVWSPDGGEIAFVRAMEPFVAGIPSCALALGDPSTGEVQTVGEVRSCADRPTFPHWSRDGSRLAYYRGVYEGDAVISTALYVFELATGDETKLTEDELFAGDSDWSADDEWLVFSTYPLNNIQCCEVSNLYRIHPDGSGLEQITEYDTPDLRASQPRYTPDGGHILFTAVRPYSRVPAVIPADGGEPITVASSGIYTHPTWQPSP